MSIKDYFTHRVIAVISIAAVVAFAFSLYTVIKIMQNTQATMTSYVPTGRYPVYPQIDLKNKTRQQIKEIQRGEYLAKVGDCIACHTAPHEGAKPFAGGLPFQTPFGTLYSPNITPDKNTGIGAWTDKDFIRALHDGISPQRHYYYPAFPYLYFNQITTPDLLALKAYFDSIPAVNQKNLINDMMFPFNIRFLQLGWRILFFYPERTGPYQYNGKQSDQWNRGKYFVEGLGHCAMCHTPSYYLIDKNVSLGAPRRKYNLTGADIEGYLAPNISRSNLGLIPTAQLMKVFKQYQMLGGYPVQGPMKEAIHDSIQYMTDKDIEAMITYLKSVDSVVPEHTTATATKMGASIYNNYCSGCHNSGVAGAPKYGNKASWDSLARSGIEKLYTIAIYGGGNMPARGGCVDCSDLKIELAVDYIVAQSKKGINPPVKKPAQSGEKVYQQYCSSCHSNTKSDAPQLGNKRDWTAIENKGFLASYRHVMDGKNGHPVKGGCSTCSDEDVIQALKYMLQKGSTKKRNYMLW